MKIRIPLFALICAVTALPVVRAQDAQKQMPAKEDQTELGARMEKMGAAFRKLRALVKDPTKNADSLAQVAILKENATEALKFDPKKKMIIPAGDQAKWISDYQAKLKTVIGHIDQLEAALKAGKNDEAEALYTTIGNEQKEGHTEYKNMPKKKAP